MLGQIRQAKTCAQKKLRWPVASLKVQGAEEHLQALKQVLTDVLLAGSAENAQVETGVGEAAEGALFKVDVTLSETDAE